MILPITSAVRDKLFRISDSLTLSSSVTLWMVECCGFEFDVKNNFPNKEKRMIFFKDYLLANRSSSSSEGQCPVISPFLLSLNCHIVIEIHDSEDFLQGFDDMVVYFTLVSDLFWGTWSIIQAKGSTIDFDYLQYAQIRYDGYYYHKDLYFDSSFHLMHS